MKRRQQRLDGGTIGRGAPLAQHQREAIVGDAQVANGDWFPGVSPDQKMKTRDRADAAQGAP